MQYILGETKNDIVIDSVEEYRKCVISMMQQAHFHISLFTQDLETEVFNNKQIEQAILQLATRHPDTRIKILVKNSDKATRNGHCLVRLARQLSSSIFINKPSVIHQDETGAFIIVDRTGLIQRTDATSRNYQAQANFNSPRHVARQQEFFSDIWENSSPDIEARRIYV